MKQPWYDEQVTNGVWLKCMKERKWKDSGNEYDYVALQYKKRHVRKVKHAKQKQYYLDLFTNISRDSKRLYAEANKLLFRKETLPLPEEKNPKILAERFNKWFTSKIEKIMAGLVPTETNPIDKSYIDFTPMTNLSFTHFNVLSCDNVKRLVKKSATKSCTLNPIPTRTPWRLHTHTNRYHQQFPTKWKIPWHIEKCSSQTTTKESKPTIRRKNLRTVSNLSYLGKLIERAACNQIVDFASSTGNIENNQSAYRVGHSTESALLKVKSDLLHALYKQEVTCFVLLDLSAAFDTVYHDVLLNILHFRYGFNEIILNWISSYLRLRTQQVLIRDNTFSDPTHLKCGVPKGSVLGPILFTLFTALLGEVCKKQGINFQSYADDQQNYLSFKPNNPTSLKTCKESLEVCISDIQKWMRTNKLKLNDETEVVLFGTRQQLEKLESYEEFKIKIGCEIIKPVKSARNLGYFMKSQLKSKTHITKVCGTSYSTLKNIARICSLFNTRSSKNNSLRLGHQ